MSNEYLTPATWGDGVTPPGFLLRGTSGSLSPLMPPLTNAFEPELNDGIIKRAKYTGKIHKSLPGTFYDCSLKWVLTADSPVYAIDGLSILADVNYLDVIYFILNIDAKMDTEGGCQLLFTPHAPDERASAEARDFKPGSGGFAWPFVNFRLTDRGGIIRSLNQKTVAKKINLKITTDGYILRIPLNTKSAPKTIYEL